MLHTEIWDGVRVDGRDSSLCLSSAPRSEVTTEFKVRMLIDRYRVNHPCSDVGRVEGPSGHHTQDPESESAVSHAPGTRMEDPD